MARKTPKGPTPVNSITHDEKRTNIPTADTVDFHDSAVLEEIRQVRYCRDESLDPQLVWGAANTRRPTISMATTTTSSPTRLRSTSRRKIDPRALIENLRGTAARPEEEPELILFESFDGLDDLQQVEFYEHDANWSNRMIFLGDSLQVMTSLADVRSSAASFRWSISTRRTASSLGRTGRYRLAGPRSQTASGTMQSVRRSKSERSVTLGRSVFTHTSLTYGIGLLRVERRRASPALVSSRLERNAHLVRSLLDEVFGSENFVATIVAQKTTRAGAAVS